MVMGDGELQNINSVRARARGYAVRHSPMPVLRFWLECGICSGCAGVEVLRIRSVDTNYSKCSSPCSNLHPGGLVVCIRRVGGA